MIDTNEIRRGNLVGVKRNGKGDLCFTKVESITNGDIFGIPPGKESDWGNIWNGIAYAKEIEGIPLTEDWILRLGFKYADDPGFDKHADAKVFYKGSLQIGIREESNKKIWRHVVYFYGYPVTTDSTLFVHSVQNLAFALMAEELTIK